MQLLIVHRDATLQASAKPFNPPLRLVVLPTAGAPAAADALPTAAHQPALPAPLATAVAGSKRKRDAAGRAGGTGKRKDSRRTVPRELALLQVHAPCSFAVASCMRIGLAWPQLSSV